MSAGLSVISPEVQALAIAHGMEAPLGLFSTERDRSTIGSGSNAGMILQGFRHLAVRSVIDADPRLWSDTRDSFEDLIAANNPKSSTVELSSEERAPGNLGLEDMLRSRQHHHIEILEAAVIASIAQANAALAECVALTIAGGAARLLERVSQEVDAATTIPAKNERQRLVGIDSVGSFEVREPLEDGSEGVERFSIGVIYKDLREKKLTVRRILGRQLFDVNPDQGHSGQDLALNSLNVDTRFAIQEIIIDRSLKLDRAGFDLEASSDLTHRILVERGTGIRRRCIRSSEGIDVRALQFRRGSRDHYAEFNVYENEAVSPNPQSIIFTMLDFREVLAAFNDVGISDGVRGDVRDSLERTA